MSGREGSLWKGTQANSPKDTMYRTRDEGRLKRIQLQGQRGQITRALHFKLRILNFNMKAMSSHQRQSGRALNFKI